MLSHDQHIFHKFLENYHMTFYMIITWMSYESPW